MKIAIIPAREGSKRIKEKNIRTFLGKPIISYVIKKILSTKLFDYVIVSTDSLKIKKIAKKYGAEVFFLRPKKISTDKAKTQDVIKHALYWFKKKNIDFDYVCCVYPTSVLIKPFDLIKSYNLIKNTKWSFIMSAQKYSTHIEKAFKLSNKKILISNKKKYYKNSQIFEDFYHDAGQFYWGTPRAWNSKK